MRQTGPQDSSIRESSKTQEGRGMGQKKACRDIELRPGDMVGGERREGDAQDTAKRTGPRECSVEAAHAPRSSSNCAMVARSSGMPAPVRLEVGSTIG